MIPLPTVAAPELRPDICREFEMGSEDCVRLRRWRGVTSGKENQP